MKLRLICTLLAVLLTLSACSAGAAIEAPGQPIEEDSQTVSEEKLPSSVVVAVTDLDQQLNDSEFLDSSIFQGPSTQEYIRQVVQDSVAQFEQPDMSEYEKVKAAFDYIISIGYYRRPIALDVWRFRTTGEQVPSYVEMRGLHMLLFDFGTCEDYASALILLLEEMGVETRYITGLTYSTSGDLIYHSWNQVKIDGVWYNLDVELEDGISNSGTLNYRYFLKSDASMSASHYWGERLISYGGDRFQPGQIETIRSEYMGEACPQDYPTPTANQIAVNPEPAVESLRAELLEELRAYEETYGKLEYVDLDIYAPVFVRYWYYSEDDPADDRSNFVRGADFIREYPVERLLSQSD